MTRIILSLAIAAAISTAAQAAEPAKTMDTALGKVLTDQHGMTLYQLDKDEPGKSNCYDKCAANWPPFAAPADAMAEGDWSVVARTDGSKMWAYKGHPLYLWIKDTKPGDTTGEGVANVWHAAKAD
jgi:predicted lipoprotein with Yx(FWY)xxD motif